MIRIVPTGDLGLDVLVGGGWRLVKRLPDLESATVVVRGGSGAGKTLIGIQVALELARALGGDVAVGCVEILPTEYVAQLQSARPSLETTRVAVLPGPSSTGDGPRVYVGLLTDLDPVEPDLVANLEALATDVESGGGNAVVFVVDSLIDGYGLGASTPRENADAVMKFAARRGCALVLCEEAATDGPSPWVFAADTVLQLGVESRERGRWIEIRKHRFGPCASGRHELELTGSEHPEVFPAPHAWITSALAPILGAHGWRFGNLHGTPLLVWGDGAFPKDGLSPLEGGFVFITSDNPEASRGFACTLRPDGKENLRTLLFEFDPLVVDVEGWDGNDLDVHYIPTVRGAARGLRALIDRFGKSTHASEVPLGRVIIGDFGLVLASTEANIWSEATRAFATIVLATRWGVPVFAYDGRQSDGGEPRARMAAHADVGIAARFTGQFHTAITRRWPRITQWHNFSPDPLIGTQVQLDRVPRARGRETDRRA